MDIITSEKELLAKQYGLKPDQIIPEDEYPPRFIVDVNYYKDKNPEKTGLIPIYLGQKGDEYGDLPKVVDIMAQSAHEHRHAAGQNIMMTIDDGHMAVRGGKQTVLGLFNPDTVESVDADLIEVPGLNPLPKGSKWLMVRPEFYLHEMNNIWHGIYGYRTSIAFDEDITKFFNFALCQVPAIEEVPPILVKQNLRVIENVQIRSNSILLKFNVKEKSMIQDETMANNLKAMLSSLGLDAAMIDGIVNLLDDANASKLMTLQPVSEEPTMESEIKSLKDATAGLLEKLTALEAKTSEPVSDPKVDELAKTVEEQAVKLNALETENATIKTKHSEFVTKMTSALQTGVIGKSKEFEIKQPEDKETLFEKSERLTNEFFKGKSVDKRTFGMKQLEIRRQLMEGDK